MGSKGSRQPESDHARIRLSCKDPIIIQGSDYHARIRLSCKDPIIMAQNPAIEENSVRQTWLQESLIHSSELESMNQLISSLSSILQYTYEA